MGELAVDAATGDEQYGILAVNYNLLRQFYYCVEDAIENDKPMEECN